MWKFVADKAKHLINKATSPLLTFRLSPPSSSPKSQSAIRFLTSLHSPFFDSMASSDSSFLVTLQSINPKVLICEYDVHGEIVTLAQQLQHELQTSPSYHPFDEVSFICLFS
ncbi:unnamed protein product [Camellia sinensis]